MQGEKGKTMSDKEDMRYSFGQLAEMAGIMMGQLEEKGFSHEEAVATASKLVVELVVNAVMRKEDGAE